MTDRSRRDFLRRSAGMAGAMLIAPSLSGLAACSRGVLPETTPGPAPCAFDAMAAFALPNGNVRLVRNHENRDGPDIAAVKGDASKAYDLKGGGGTTSLEVPPRQGRHGGAGARLRGASMAPS